MDVMDLTTRSVMKTPSCLVYCVLVGILLETAFTAALTAPKFVQHPQSQVVKQNSKAVLHCMIVPEAAQIRWTFNGLPLETGPGGVEVRNGRVTIQAFRHSRRGGGGGGASGGMESHEGEYQCVANNSAGAVLSNTARLERAFLGQFPDADDQTVRATEGNTALIQCHPPRGKPRPAISFQRDGRTLDTSSARHHVLPSGGLQIAEVRQSDEGAYKCISENPVSGQIRVSGHTVSLQVRSPTTNSAPRFVEKLQKRQSVEQGEELVLECVVQGSPVPVVMWDKHNGELPRGRSSTVLGNLVIRDAQLADQGTYICRAENTVGVPTADIVAVDVLEPPSIRIPPADQVAIEGATVVFQCVARGRDVLTQWLYNAKPVPSRPQYTISDTSLTISRVTGDDGGVYQCVARSPLGMTSSAALLQVKGKDDIDFTWPEVPDINDNNNNNNNNGNIPLTAPFITVSPSNTSVDVGRTLILPCQATTSTSTVNSAGSQASATDSTTIAPPLLSPAYITGAEPYLSVQGRDSLSTLPPEQAVSPSPSSDQYSGESPASNTSSPATQPPVSITWYHNGNLIKGLFLEDGVWIPRSDEEVKRLESLQTQKGLDELNIFDSNDDYNDDDGYSDSVIDRGVNRTGSESIDLSDKQKELRVGTLVSSKGLQIVQVTSEDSGVYTCVASNSLGFSYVTAYLHVIEPPSPSSSTVSPDMGRSTEHSLDPFPSLRPEGRNNPRGRNNSDRNRDRPDLNLVPPTTPQIKMLTESSVMVRWNVPPNNGLDITFFKIQYKDVSARNRPDRQWKTYSMDIPSTTFMHEVRRLKCGVNYKFRVFAVYSNNDNRWSPASRRFMMDCDETATRPLASGPVIVKADPISADTISLKWQYHQENSGEIEGYYIYYKPFQSQGDYSRQEILGGNIQRYVLKNLKPGTYYTIRMRSYNKQGEGPYSNDVVKSTLDGSGGIGPSDPFSGFPTKDNNGLVTTTRRPSLGPGGAGGSSTRDSNQTLYMVLGIALGLALVCLLIIMLVCWRRQRRERRANNAQKSAGMHKKEQQMNGGPHHQFLLHNMNANHQNGLNGSLRNGRAGQNGTGHLGLTTNPYQTGTTTLPRTGDQTSALQQDGGSERNYSPEDLEIQNLRRSLQELLHAPPAPPLPAHERGNGVPVYYSNTASTVNINTRNQPNYYEVDPSHQDTLPRVHMATFGCADCNSSRSRPQSRAESSLSNAPPPEYNSLGLRAQPMFPAPTSRSSTEIPDYSGSLHRQKPITNPYHIYSKDPTHAGTTGGSQYRNSPDHIPRSHERPPFRPHAAHHPEHLYSRSLRGPQDVIPYPPGYDAATASKYGGGEHHNNNPEIYEQVSDSHSVGGGSSSGRLRGRRKSPHSRGNSTGSSHHPRNNNNNSGGGQPHMGFRPVGGVGGQRVEQSQGSERVVNLGRETSYPTSQALPAAMFLPQPIRGGDDDESAMPPRLPPRNLQQGNSSPYTPAGDSHRIPSHTHSSDSKESPQVIDDLSQELPVLGGSLEASYGTGTDTAPPSSGHGDLNGDLNATTSDNLDSDLEGLSDNEGISECGDISFQQHQEEEERSPLVLPPSLSNTSRGAHNGRESSESTPLMQRNIPRANDYPSDDDNEDC